MALYKQTNHKSLNLYDLLSDFNSRLDLPEPEVKEFKPRLKSKPQLKYGWFPLKLYLIFQDLIRLSIETGFFGDLTPGLNSLNSASGLSAFLSIA